MASLGRLTIDMVANLGGFERDMGRADRVTRKAMTGVRRELRSAERDMAKAQASLKNLGMQFAVLAGVSIGVVVREFRSLAQQADRLDKLAAGTGASVEAIQRLGFAAEQSGTSMEVLVKGLTTMQRNLQGASDGLATQQRALERINISHKDLIDLNPEQQFLRIADALNKTENATVRSATAQEIFGRAGRELLAMFDSGVDTIAGFAEELERTGAIMSGEMTSNFARFNDQMNLLSRQFTGLKVQIFGDLIGPMADFVEFLNTEEGTRLMREKLDAIGTAAQVVGGIIAVRFVAQLVTATVQMGIASVQTIRLTAQLAALGTGATAASAAFSRLGFAIRMMFGPVGIAAAAIGTFMLASQDATGSLGDFEEAIRDLRIETGKFSSQQQIIDDINAYRENAKKTKDTLEELIKKQAILNVLMGDRNPGESLRDYSERTKEAARQSKNLQKEIEQQFKILDKNNKSLEKANKLLDEYVDPAQAAADATEELNEQLADNQRQKFLLDMEDISDELAGPAFQAARKFAREIERLQGLLDGGIISAEEFANAATGFVQLANLAKTVGSSVGGNLASALATAISTSDGRNMGQTIGNAFKTSGMQGITEGLQEAFSQALSNLNLEDAETQGYMVAIGEAIAGNIGAAIGTALGTAIGAALGGATGAQIGSIIGNAVGSLFDRQKDPKFQIGGTSGFASTGGMAQSSFETIFGQQLVRFRNVEDAIADQIKTALIDFDNAIASFITDKTQLGAITAALRNFAFDSQDEALSVEELLRQRFNAVLNTFDSFTQGIVRQAFGLEAQANRLAELIDVQRQMLFTGNMGFGSDQALISEIAGMQRGTETLVDTFNRFTQTMTTLNQLSDLLNVNLRGGTMGIRAFGDELLRIFGDDMQRFQQSMSKIFDTFFDTTEVLESVANAERARATRLLESLGVAVTEATFTTEGFRELFENLFPTLDASDAAVLIEAGVAVANLIDNEERLTDARREQSGVLTQLTAEGEAFAQAMIATEEAIALTPLNAFQREMVGIQRNLHRTISAINAAAGSAITQEAAERALARAHEAAAIQASAAIARLEASTLRLVQQVFGTPLDEINRQIGLLESNSNSVADAIGNAARAMEDLIAFADSLLVGRLSPLPSRERLGLGLEQLRAASEAGDVQAVQSLAQQVLQIGRERFASGPEFGELFQEVQDIIRGTTPADDTQQVTVVESPALEALFRERDAVNAEIAAADRRANAFQIAQNVADIANATGLSFETVGKNLGINLGALAAALGIDVEELDTLLQTMAVDTDSIARTLETFAREIRDSILQMTNAILEALGKQADEQLPKGKDALDDQVISPTNPIGAIMIPGPVDQGSPPMPPPDIAPAPPAPPFTPPGDTGVFDIENNKGPITFADLVFGKDVVKNTKETTEAVNRLTDAITKSTTRSSRTALA